MLQNLKIVLVNTTHPGNIGASARAMKNMGLSQLVLVAPERFPDGEAVARSSGATDLLDQAVVVDTLEEAIADCELVIGTSARSRKMPLTLIDPRQCAEKVMAEVSCRKVALVFGREDRGLTNEELQQCHFHVHIPSVAEFSSLNLGAAVQVLAYEVRMAALAQQQEPAADARELASMAEMEGFYRHLEDVLWQIEFLQESNAKAPLAKLRRFYGRGRPDKVELSMLRGILSETQRSLDKPAKGD